MGTRFVRPKRMMHANEAVYTGIRQVKTGWKNTEMFVLVFPTSPLNPRSSFAIMNPEFVKPKMKRNTREIDEEEITIMKIPKKFAAMLLAAGCCMAVVLGGCGKNDETATTAAQTAAETAADTTAAAETTAEQTTAGQQSAEGFETVDETVYVTSRVNVRVEPNTSCESLGVLEVGTSVHRIGYNETWSQVDYNGQVCYIASQYLSAEPVEATTAPQANAGGTAPSTSLGVDFATGAAFTDPVDALSNEAISYGYLENDRDAYNRPNGVFYYESKYGYYGDSIGPNSNTIYLTMDEGYEAGFTPTILDTLKEKNVKATFFITKQFYDSNPEYIQRMIDEGHVIGNHTCAHPSGGIQQLGVEGTKEDLMKLHNLVLDTFGYEMKLFRYPEGTFSEQSLQVVHDLGYRPIWWSFAHVDWKLDDQPDPAESLQKCLDSLHPGAIYLLHAESATNTEILGDFIDGARARGYDFAAIPETGL